MHENRRLLLDMIFVFIYYSIMAVCIGYPIFLTCYVNLMNKPQLWNNNRIMISLCLLFVAIVMNSIILFKHRARFDGIKLASDVYSYDFQSIDNLLEIIKKNSIENGYLYEKMLITDDNEKFVIYSNEDKKFPSKKIGVYINDEYKCETFGYDYQGGPGIKPGLAKKNKRYKVFFDMICCKWGRSYDYPRDWVNIETTIIVVVDKWNDMLNWAMNHGGHLPFVMICVISKNEPGKLYIAKDNRKNKRNDYIVKKEELLDILEVDNRNILCEMKYSEMSSKIINN